MIKGRKQRQKDWWRVVFDERYIKIYIDTISLKRTKKEVDFIVKSLNLKKSHTILDLACGHGRHTIEFARRGYDVAGLDQSKYFVDIARNRAKSLKNKPRFARGDMRSLRFRNEFNVVINIFTSFGYFEREEDDLRVLRGVYRSLKKGGVFFIDLPNVFSKVQKITSSDRRRPKQYILSNGIKVSIKEGFSPHTFKWITKTTWKEKRQTHSYHTDVRIYTAPEITKLLQANGLRVKKIYGGFNGKTFTVNSPRLIILAEKI